MIVWRRKFFVPGRSEFFKTVLDEDILYCKFCFENECDSESGNISSVYTGFSTTSTGNFLAHALTKHGFQFVDTSPKLSQHHKIAGNLMIVVVEYQLSFNVCQAYLCHLCCALLATETDGNPLLRTWLQFNVVFNHEVQLLHLC